MKHYLSALLVILPLAINGYNLSPESQKEREKAEINTFASIWQGGFYIGNPLEKACRDSSQFQTHVVSYKGERMSCLHAVYLECIKPYVNETTNVLEIGCGRGAWTRCFLKHNAQHITCIDAKTAKDNDFWLFTNHPKNVSYFKVNDCSLHEIEDDSLDYVFSALAFCHISPALIKAYLTNMFKKMRSGAHAFIMYADYDKYNNHYKSLGHSQSRIKENLEVFYSNHNNLKARWYHLGIDTMHNMLEEIGYTIVSSDIDIDYRDPIAHFIKP